MAVHGVKVPCGSKGPDRYGRCDDPYYGAGISGKIYRGKTERAKFTMLFNAMLFIGFIALNIASSSVTIRVEMRWIYVSLLVHYFSFLISMGN